jgi:hypothetical protein
VTGASPETANVIEALPAVDPQAWMNMGDIAMSTLLRTHDAMIKGMAAWSREMIDFTQMRLHEGADGSEHLFHCTDPLAALDLHRQFTVKATGQYLEEAGKLTTIAMRTAGLCWTPIEEGTREALDRIAPVSANGSMVGV